MIRTDNEGSNGCLIKCLRLIDYYFTHLRMNVSSNICDWSIMTMRVAMNVSSNVCDRSIDYYFKHLQTSENECLNLHFDRLLFQTSVIDWLIEIPTHVGMDWIFPLICRPPICRPNFFTCHGVLKRVLKTISYLSLFCDLSMNSHGLDLETRPHPIPCLIDSSFLIQEKKA